jgi:hypothetical protein
MQRGAHSAMSVGEYTSRKLIGRDNGDGLVMWIGLIAL